MSATINPPSVLATGAYNHAVVRAGTPVFLTGQVAWDVDGGVVGVGDAAAQAAQAWSNLNAILVELGAAKDDIVKITTYVTDLADLPAISAAKTAQFAGHTMPASTFLVVAGLAEPELLVEIEAIVMVRR